MQYFYQQKLTKINSIKNLLFTKFYKNQQKSTKINKKSTIKIIGYDYSRKFDSGDIQRLKNIYKDKQIIVNTKFILKSQDYDLLIDNYDVVDLSIKQLEDVYYDTKIMKETKMYCKSN